MPNSIINSRLHFLNLPRELRDHIYAYLLITPPTLVRNQTYTPVPDVPQTTQIRSSYRIRCKNLSVLRVNRQVHAEASEAFYKRNVWPIRMVLSLGCAQPVDCSYNLYATYEAPWEEVAYGTVSDGGANNGAGRFFDAERFYSTSNTGPLQPKEAIQGKKPGLYPAKRYRKFLRRVKMEIIDLRFHEVPRETEPGITGEFEEEYADAARSLILPFMGRLKALLEPAGGKVRVNIRLLGDWRHRSTVDREPAHDAMSLETIWPLLHGGWKTQLQTGFDHGEQRRYRDGILGRCEEYESFEKSRILGFEGVDVAGDCYFARVRGRVKLLRNGMLYDCCYGCDKRILDAVVKSTRVIRIG
ncbi:hypothetical protein TWF730_008555 [Orbilia blumenaviensis]|uniref:F-box domain-containing protein n=1 Tax=Orbilia blumenaviensis TaxID=1796055 RepID=A0AAV9V3V9_9PEZI